MAMKTTGNDAFQIHEEQIKKKRRESAISFKRLDLWTLDDSFHARRILVVDFNGICLPTEKIKLSCEIIMASSTVEKSS